MLKLLKRESRANQLNQTSNLNENNMMPFNQKYDLNFKSGSFEDYQQLNQQILNKRQLNFSTSFSSRLLSPNLHHAKSNSFDQNLSNLAITNKIHGFSNSFDSYIPSQTSYENLLAEFSTKKLSATAFNLTGNTKVSEAVTPSTFINKNSIAKNTSANSNYVKNNLLNITSKNPFKSTKSHVCLSCHKRFARLNFIIEITILSNVDYL
jgi:hypothetical protein